MESNGPGPGPGPSDALLDSLPEVNTIEFPKAKRLNFWRTEVRWIGKKHQWVIGKYQIALWWSTQKNNYQSVFSFAPLKRPTYNPVRCYSALIQDPRNANCFDEVLLLRQEVNGEVTYHELTEGTRIWTESEFAAHNLSELTPLNGVSKKQAKQLGIETPINN